MVALKAWLTLAKNGNLTAASASGAPSKKALTSSVPTAQMFQPSKTPKGISNLPTTLIVSGPFALSVQENLTTPSVNLALLTMTGLILI